MGMLMAACMLGLFQEAYCVCVSRIIAVHLTMLTEMTQSYHRHQIQLVYFEIQNNLSIVVMYLFETSPSELDTVF